MKRALPLAGVLLLTVPLLADHQHVVFDETVDFSSVHTFTIRDGRATTTRTELNNRLMFKNVQEAIRTQLVAKGLKEAATQADVEVDFSLGQDKPNGPSVAFDEGVIVVQFFARGSRQLIWHGTYRDETSSPGKLAERLPSCIKKLLAAYPPKKK